VASGPPVEELERLALERGHEQGYAEAARIAQQLRDQHAEQLGAVLDALRGRFAELEGGAAEALLALAIEIARRVVRRDVAQCADAALPVVREALALVIDHHARPDVHLHPDDLELIRRDLEPDGRFKGCRFVADAAVEHGGCRVETPQGDIDGRLATRWRRVLADLGYPDEALGPAAAHPAPATTAQAVPARVASAPNVPAPDIAAQTVPAPDIAAPDIAAQTVRAPDIAAPDIVAQAVTAPAAE
jgi:flagellar assembly protein FliH